MGQGVKQMEEKQFIIVIISTYKWAGITKEKNVTLLNMIFIKHRHSQHSIERNATYKKPVSDLSESRDSYIYECLNLICYHLRATTKIW